MKNSTGWVFVALLLLSSGLKAAETSTESLYGLPISLQDQEGRIRSLDLYRGHPVIVTMFYSSCPNACPLLIESLRATEQALTANARADVRVLMITLDPERDTSAALARLASTRRVDLKRWTLARVLGDDVRVLAAALGVQYRKLPDGEYNHTSVLTLVSPAGVLGKQTATLGKADPTFVTAVEQAAKSER